MSGIQKKQDYTGEDAEDSLRVLRHAVRSSDLRRLRQELRLEHNPPTDLAKIQAWRLQRIMCSISEDT